MENLNIRVSGRVQKKPEMKTTKNGKSFWALTVVVEKLFNGARKDIFISVYDYSKNSNCKLINENNIVTLEGEPWVKSWLTQDGKPRGGLCVTTFHVDRMEALPAERDCAEEGQSDFPTIADINRELSGNNKLPF